MLTPKGKVYSEVTVARPREDEFYIVSYPEMQFHDGRWLKQHLGIWDKYVGDGLCQLFFGIMLCCSIIEQNECQWHYANCIIQVTDISAGHISASKKKHTPN